MDPATIAIMAVTQAVSGLGERAEARAEAGPGHETGSTVGSMTYDDGRVCVKVPRARKTTATARSATH